MSGLRRQIGQRQRPGQGGGQAENVSGGGLESGGSIEILELEGVLLGVGVRGRSGGVEGTGRGGGGAMGDIKEGLGRGEGGRFEGRRRRRQWRWLCVGTHNGGGRASRKRHSSETKHPRKAQKSDPSQLFFEDAIAIIAFLFAFRKTASLYLDSGRRHHSHESFPLYAERRQASIWI